jgi:chromosome segregation ATPase
MDTDTMKRKIAQELHDQFEGKLREARRQKTEAEEELESASERWRSERRRLNTEIDRLEAALTDAKTATVKKPADTEEAKAAAAEWATRLAAAEERMTTSAAEWDTERLRLEGEIQRLEHSVAEILERSNNPVRSLHGIQQKLETQLADAIGARQRMEDDFGRAKAAWEEERLKIAGEVFRLRRDNNSASPAKAGAEAEALQRAHGEIERLQRQLAEARDAAKTAAQSSTPSKKTQELTKKNSELAQELSDARTSLNEEKQRLADSATQLAQAQAEIERLHGKVSEAGAAANSKATKSLKARHAAELEEINREKTELAEKLEEAIAQLELERKRATNAAEDLENATDEIHRLERSVEDTQTAVRAEVAQQMGAEYSAEIEQVLREKAALAGKLESADALLAQERDRAATINEELRQARVEAQQRARQLAERPDPGSSAAGERLRAELNAQLQQTAQERNSLAGQLEKANGAMDHAQQQLAAADEEIARLRTQVSQTQTTAPTEVGAQSTDELHAQYEALLQQLTQEKTELAAQLEKVTGQATQERNLAAAVTEELRRARNKVQQTERHLAEIKESRNAEGLERVRGQYVSKVQELTEQNESLIGQLEGAGVVLEKERMRSAGLEEELQQARMETEQLERRLSETRESVSADVVEQLRAQYTAKIQEIAREKTELAGQLERASGLLDQERQRFSTAAGGSANGANGVDLDALEREVVRVEEAIAEITRFIDDPSAQLATVIRKNVERAELDAYLKGIIFARGIGTGVAS